MRVKRNNHWNHDGDICKCQLHIYIYIYLYVSSCIDGRIFYSPKGWFQSLVPWQLRKFNHNIWGPAQKNTATVEAFITVTGFSNRPQITLAHKETQKIHPHLTSQNRAQCSFSPKNLKTQKIPTNPWLTDPGFFVEKTWNKTEAHRRAFGRVAIAPAHLYHGHLYPWLVDVMTWSWGPTWGEEVKVEDICRLSWLVSVGEVETWNRI